MENASSYLRYQASTLDEAEFLSTLVDEVSRAEEIIARESIVPRPGAVTP